MLEMVSEFLLITQDHRVPPTASLHFRSCFFDSASGEIFLINIHQKISNSAGLFELKAYLNYYMLSRVIMITECVDVNTSLGGQSHHVLSHHSQQLHHFGQKV